MCILCAFKRVRVSAEPTSQVEPRPAFKVLGGGGLDQLEVEVVEVVLELFKRLTTLQTYRVQYS